MSKRKKRKRIDISPATVLRPRLDKLWADEALLHKEDAAIGGDLDVLARDVEPDFFVKTMLRAYVAASEPARDRMDRVLPRWLSERNCAETLEEMARARSLGPDLRPLALTWLEAAGVDTEPLESPPSLFLEAYYHDDEALLGEKSQAYVASFRYTSSRRNRAQGMGFLLDYNPPWDGSVKDILITPRRRPQKLLKYVMDFWERSDMEPESVSAERAKTVILTALNCNRAADVRLPRDLIGAREIFERHVLSLPDGPDTPSFTMDDFDHLAGHGKSPEEIVHFEQTVGRRIRLEDGSEVVVMGGPGWGDEEW